ncbi:TPA: AAA family ATPase [Klebsiella oxytoca]|nr:AAA family ATPase [Klebsiella oxytoca]HCJ7378758.1 AAA family ATPase [Klebsiella oxytoca]HDX4249464.1 AAA family ATPase [Klebsiella oxytoca]
MFLCRGLQDVIGYLTLCNLQVPTHMERATEMFRYAQTVFTAPPWKDIYVQDVKRKHSFGETAQRYHAMADAYGRYGYNLISLPLCGPEVWAEIILSSLYVRHHHGEQS